VIAISKAIYSDIERKGLKNIDIVYNGINHQNIERKKSFNSTIQIVCIGRLDHTIKGQDILLKAFALLKNDIKNVSLNFIGDGSSKEYLQQITKNLELEKEVIFHGEKTRSELYKMIKDFDILVQPSIHEGFGLTVVEAMVARVPVIISDALGLKEVTNNGLYAQDVIANNDAEKYYKAILNLIININTKSSILMEKIDTAEKNAVENFSIESTCLNYSKIYNEICLANN
jgi:glycosyltransferase involved in cell wall biosynthesis